MKIIKLVFLLLNIGVLATYGQKINLEANNLVANQVSLSFEKLEPPRPRMRSFFAPAAVAKSAAW